MYHILDPLDYIVLEFEELSHTAGRLISDFRCMVILFLNRHGIMSEEYDILLIACTMVFGFGLIKDGMNTT